MSELVKQEEHLPSTAPVLQMIERLAMSPDIDVTKLEKMLDMQERILDRDAEMAFNQAMVRAQRGMPTIQKKAFNQQTSSFYATLDEVNKGAVPVYTNEGFSVSYNTVDSAMGEGYIRVVAYVSHEQGHTREYQYDMPIDNAGIKGSVNKTLVHGRASSVSYGQRYLICLIFNISAAKDVDGNQPKAESDDVKPGTLKNLRELMAKVERTDEQCLEFLKSAANTEYKSLDKISETHARRLLGKISELLKSENENEAS
jgi:hypothetical protein